ncbi:hypothetical protein [Victivallis vadensis]|uniref:hypothetical protein n=1 Tax=Victivallis vadensis TaxID=172901 RepID=UPI003D0691D7
MRVRIQPDRSHESGAALVSALAMLATAGLLVLALVAVSRVSTVGVATYTDLMRSGYIAEGAGNRVRYLIEADRQLYGTSRAEDIKYEDYDTDRYLADSIEHEIDYYGTPVKFVITSALSGVAMTNVNALDVFSYDRDTESAVTDLLGEFADQLSDYIDTDDESRTDGFEVADYEGIDMNALPRNASPQFREELLWLPAAKTLLPLDKDGRLTLIRQFGIPSGNPSIYTVNYTMLRTMAQLEEEQAKEVLRALELWRKERTPLGDQLDELVLPQLQRSFSWNEPEYYTVTVRQAAPEGRPTSRLVYSFRSDGVAGPSDKIATYYEYLKF